jgi:hypothetical protein
VRLVSEALFVNANDLLLIEGFVFGWVVEFGEDLSRCDLELLLVVGVEEEIYFLAMFS